MVGFGSDSLTRERFNVTLLEYHCSQCSLFSRQPSVTLIYSLIGNFFQSLILSSNTEAVEASLTFVKIVTVGRTHIVNN